MDQIESMAIKMTEAEFIDYIRSNEKKEYPHGIEVNGEVFDYVNSPLEDCPHQVAHEVEKELNYRIRKCIVFDFQSKTEEELADKLIKYFKEKQC